MARPTSMLAAVCCMLTIMTTLGEEAMPAETSDAAEERTGNIADFHNPNYVEYNLNMVLSGYDIDKGNPIPSKISLVDSGFRVQIFNPMVGPNDFGTYAQHGGIHTHPLASCSRQQRTTTVSTVKGYTELVKKELTIENNLQLGLDMEVNLGAEADVGPGSVSGGVTTDVPPLLKRGFGLAINDQHGTAFFGTEQGVMTVTQADCAVASIKIHRNNPPPFTTGFLNTLVDLMGYLDATQDNQKAKVTEFIEEYGTHFFKEAVMGARLRSTRKFSRKTSQNKKAAMLRHCIDDNWQAFMFPIGVGERTDNCSLFDITKDEEIDQEYKTSVVTTYGTRAMTLEEWQNEKFENPMPLKMKLSPILNLFTKRNFDPKSHEDDYTDEDKDKLSKIDHIEILKMISPVYFAYCGKRDCSEPKGCGYNDDCDRRETICIDKDGTKKGYECGKRMCYDNPCKNSGFCNDVKSYEDADTNGMYECTCQDGFYGDNCQHPVLPDTDTLKKELHSKENELYDKYNGGRHEKFTNDIGNYFNKKYTGHTFLVICYGPLEGKHHSIIGNTFHSGYKGKGSGGHKGTGNCFVGYSKKRDYTFNDESLKTIQTGIRKVSQARKVSRGKQVIRSKQNDAQLCKAESMLEVVWRYATNELSRSPIAAFMCQPYPCDGGTKGMSVKSFYDDKNVKVRNYTFSGCGPFDGSDSYLSIMI